MQDNTAVIHSSASDEWETPQPLYDELNKEFYFQLDPCCTVKTQKAPAGYGLDTNFCGDTKVHTRQNGLEVNWYQKGFRRSFVNPHYSQIGKWVAKCHAEMCNGCMSVMLIPGRTGTSWWHKYMPNAYEIREIEGRVYFKGIIKVPGQPKDTPKDQIKYEMGIAPAPFDSVVVVFKPKSAGQLVKRTFWKVPRR